MKASLIALLPVLWAAPALAQHAGHAGEPAAPSSKPAPAAPPPAADPHAGHDMGAMPGMASNIAAMLQDRYQKKLGGRLPRSTCCVGFATW